MMPETERQEEETGQEFKNWIMLQLGNEAQRTEVTVRPFKDFLLDLENTGGQFDSLKRGNKIVPFSLPDSVFKKACQCV